MSSKRSVDPLTRRLLVITLLALVLRVALVFSGGQFYWPDENRYSQSQAMLEEFSTHQTQHAILRLSNGDHPLFKLIGLIPAGIERYAGPNPFIPGVYFSFFSAANVLLVGLIARRLGSPPGEATLAALLVTASSSLFYFSRHIVPYDVAMMLGLVALFIGTRPDDAPWTSVWCGVLAGCAFLTYAGYWTLSGVVLMLHVLAAGSLPQAARRTVLAAAGLVAPVIAVMAVTLPVGGNLAQSFLSFSNTITQGDFAEGWRLPWEYLWYTEHGLAVLWLAATVCVPFLKPRSPHSARVALLGFAAAYGSLVITSTVMHKFVVYGRLSRQIVPFLCLATAGSLWSLGSRTAPRWRTIVIGGVVAFVAVQAAFNMAGVFRVTFPLDFLREGRADPRVTSPDMLFPINAEHFYPAPVTVALPDAFIILRRAPHPLQFRPYQYEGYTPSQRALLRSRDITMTLLLVPQR